MKRSGKSNEQVQKFPKTASPKADSRAVVVNKTQAQVDELSLITRNQEELVDELSLITRQATGTQSHDVADRIIEQSNRCPCVAEAEGCERPGHSGRPHHGGDGTAECDRSHAGCADDRSQ